MMRGLARAAAVVSLAMAVAMALGSCAYYNTYYLARKNYDRGTGGLPYLPDRPDPANAQYFTKAIDFSKKVLAQYPKDKLVDDAYLLWARGLLGTDDPRQAIKLLEDFPDQFPQSSLQPDARFYLGVANRQARKYTIALHAFDDFLAMAPKKHELRPYAYLERARVLTSLERHGDAAQAAGEAIRLYPKFKLIDRARLARAEALLAQGAYEDARVAFHDLGNRADTDEERLRFLLRESESLEAGRRYDEELRLLNDAIAHETPPIRADTTGGRTDVQGVAGSPGYGQILVRIGTSELLSGNMDKALDAYRRVAQDYSRTPLGAEAQYRVGYAFETAGDDFDKARIEYQRVSEHGAGSSYVDQAHNRLANLDRLAQFKNASGDSADKKSEAAFLLAEVYLFQLEKPDRALEEYRKIATDFAGTPMAGKALNAAGWVLSRKLERKREADSLFWEVVHQYPKTEAQLAARDYLEMEGVVVPDTLIQFPEPKIDTTRVVPPLAVEPIDSIPPNPADSLALQLGPRGPGGVFPPGIDRRHQLRPPIPGAPPGSAFGTPPASPDSLPPFNPASPDSLPHFTPTLPDSFPNPPSPAPRDSGNVHPAQPGQPSPSPSDSTKAPK